MATEKKYSTYLSEAESRLRQLSIEKLRLAVVFLAYLQETEENEVTEKLLLNIPDFAESFGEVEQKYEDKLENTASNQLASDEEVWQTYLAVEKKWEEVFRRLADS